MIEKQLFSAQLTTKDAKGMSQRSQRREVVLYKTMEV